MFVTYGVGGRVYFRFSLSLILSLGNDRNSRIYRDRSVCVYHSARMGNRGGGRHRRQLESLVLRGGERARARRYNGRRHGRGVARSRKGPYRFCPGRAPNGGARALNGPPSPPPPDPTVSARKTFFRRHSAAPSSSSIAAAAAAADARRLFPHRLAAHAFWAGAG